MISVIIPLYNKETIIERTLRTVLFQDYDNYEVIVVDDGSTDKSLSVVERELSKIECELNLNVPVQIISQENGGPSKSRNTGVKYANGEWIVFLDADDELTEGALQYFSEITKQYSDADIVDCGGYIRRGNNLCLRYHPLDGRVNNPLRAFFYRTISPGCGHSIFKTSFVRQYPYDERMRRFEDCDVLLRMLPNAIVYSTQYPTEIHDVNYAEASNARKYINEDIMGYLHQYKGGFWMKMCVYQMFISERNHYSEECRKLYSTWYWRYDLLSIMKVLKKLKFFQK